MDNEFQQDTTLQLLNEIERKEFRSQRSFADRFGIAVGLSNAYIKRCVRKGWVKMRKAPAHRYAYYLTPKGFAEKARLTSDYLARSFRFFREARMQCVELLQYCEREGFRKVALYGSGELTEIAVLAAREAGVQLMGTVSPETGEADFRGLPVKRDIDDLGDFDALIITDIHRPQQVFDELKGRIPENRLLAPPLLLVSDPSPPDQ